LRCFLNKIVSEKDVVVIIAIIGDSSIYLAFGKDLEKLVVKPLSQRSVFSGEFDDFLSNYTSPERVAG